MIEAEQKERMEIKGRGDKERKGSRVKRRGRKEGKEKRRGKGYEKWEEREREGIIHQDITLFSSFILLYHHFVRSSFLFSVSPFPATMPCLHSYIDGLSLA